MKKASAGSAVAVTVLVLALFLVQRPWEWKGYLGHVRKEDFVCKAGTYTTEIISIDPQLIYINNFFHDDEINGLCSRLPLLSCNAPSPAPSPSWAPSSLPTATSASHN